MHPNPSRPHRKAMKRLAPLLIALAAAGYSVQAAADTRNLRTQCANFVTALAANDLPPGRTPEEYFGAGYCFGTLRGIFITNEASYALNGEGSQSSRLFCDDGFSAAKFAKAVVAYIDNDPSSLERNESIVALEALHDKYPCGKD